MGSWDCYCALCAGPLGVGNAGFGKAEARGLRKRRTKAEKLREEQETEVAKAPDLDHEKSSSSVVASIVGLNTDPRYSEGIPDADVSSAPAGIDPNNTIHEVEFSPKDSDTWSQESDLDLPESCTYSVYGDERDSHDSEEDYREYDASFFQPGDLRWVNRCRCLASIPHDTGSRKTYISGRGCYNDYGAFVVSKPGRDAHDPGTDQHTCFYIFDGDDTVAFPFHEACMKTLSHALGYSSVKEIDMDILYGVFSAHTVEYGSCLDLEYGVAGSHEQFYFTGAGEEYVVCDPSLRPDFIEDLRDALPASLFTEGSRSRDLSHKVRHDTLSVLPYDVLLEVFDHLSTQDVISLMKASYHANVTTREPAFWKHLLRMRLVPLFPELSPFLATTVSTTFNYRVFFLWFDKTTTPERGNHGPLMGLANRRRIWAVCQQITPLYQERYIDATDPVGLAESEHDGEAELIWDEALSLHTPMVSFPQPESPTKISAQFVQSWRQLYQPCDFGTYWSRDSGRLIGITMSFRGRQTVFGSTAGDTGIQLHIGSGDSIKQINVMMSKVDVLRGRATSIIGMTVELNSGRRKSIKGSNSLTRPFIVLEGMHLIGLAGEVDTNGIITRLGLVQAFRRDEKPLVMPSYTIPQQRLWTNSACHVYHTRHSDKPIYAHPFYRLHMFGTNVQENTGNVPPDVVPHELLLFAPRTTSPPHPSDIRGIESFEPLDAQSLAEFTGACDDRRIVGMRPSETTMWNGRWATQVGSGESLPFQHEQWGGGLPQASEILQEIHTRFQRRSFDPEHTTSFPVDGIRGEVITEVHTDHEFKAIKLVTNWGREGYFGAKKRTKWHIKKAEEGERILGLSVCFGRLGGWSEARQMWSHWELSDVGVVYCKIDEKGNMLASSEGEGH